MKNYNKIKTICLIQTCSKIKDNFNPNAANNLISPDTSEQTFNLAGEFSFVNTELIQKYIYDMKGKEQWSEEQWEE